MGYQEKAARTINWSLDKPSMTKHALFGMASEVGELQGLYQKEYQGKPFDRDHAIKELGDLMWFVAEWCTANDITLEEVMDINIRKLMNRYPEGFDVDRSEHRQAGDI